jgi:2,3-bisphosphoglycerate-independent phosphoglycerate mutase
MFTLEKIQNAHKNVKSGADFPQYIRELKALGVRSYDHYVGDGTTVYRGEPDYMVSSNPKYPAVQISIVPSEPELASALRIHQAGETDYPTFCRQAAGAGVEKWTVDLVDMTCIYYDRSGAAMIREKIPA